MLISFLQYIVVRETTLCQIASHDRKIFLVSACFVSLKFYLPKQKLIIFKFFKVECVISYDRPIKWRNHRVNYDQRSNVQWFTFTDLNEHKLSRKDEGLVNNTNLPIQHLWHEQQQQQQTQFHSNLKSDAQEMKLFFYISLSTETRY